MLVSLVGIVLVGMAGMSKEKELPEEEKKKAVAEFNFKKGILVAIFSGIMSAGMASACTGGAQRSRSSRLSTRAPSLRRLERHAGAGGRAARRLHLNSSGAST